MRRDIIVKLVIKEFRDLTKNVSILPIVLMAPFLAFIMTQLNQAPKEYLIPIWVIYALAMVGIMIPGFLTAEEKEKGTLDSLLVSPVRHNEIIAGKIIFALVIIFVDVILVMVPNGGFLGNQLWIWLGVILASTFFIQVGLIIGLFTENQVGAGAISSPAMLFFFLTPMFVDLLPGFFKVIIEYMPSLAVMEMIKTGILNNPINETLPELITLVVWNIIAYFFTKLGVKHQFQ